MAFCVIYNKMLLYYCCFVVLVSLKGSLGQDDDDLLTDPKIVMLRNGTEERQLNTTDDLGSIVIDKDPFDFIYENLSILWWTVSYSDTGVERRHFQNITDRDILIRYIYGSPSIQYDWRNRNIYWVQNDIIEVSDITGKYRLMLYTEDTGQINYMVIDPSYGYMFWSVSGNVAKIERAGMHGDEATRVTIMNEGIRKPFGLATDSQYKHLYWSDNYLKMIERCSYSGNERVTLVRLEFEVPGHVAFFKGTLYWIGRLEQTLNAFQTSSNATRKVANIPPTLMSDFVYNFRIAKKEPIISILYLRVFENLRDKNVANFDNDTGVTSNCEQLGLTQIDSPEAFCRCSAHLNMAKDGSCTEVEDQDWKLIFSASVYGICEISNETITELSSIVPNKFVFLDNDTIVYTLGFEMFMSSLENVSAHQSVVELPFQAYSFDLEYDWVGDNLYWAVNGARQGFVFLLKLRSPHGVISSILQSYPHSLVYDLALDVRKREFFALRETSKVSIGRQSMVANEALKLLTNLEGRAFSGISIDTKNEIVYIRGFHSTRAFSILYRYTYSGERLKDQYSQIGTNVAFVGKYMITQEIESRGIVFLQCDRRFMGNCKSIFKNSGPQIPTYSLRIYPEHRNYSGNHPCRVNNGNCSHFCTLTHHEPFYKCICDRNIHNPPDTRTCEKHPCQPIRQDKCSMICHPAEGYNYTCSCSHGFTLASDGKTCHGDMGLTIIGYLLNNLHGFELIGLSSGNYIPLVIHTETEVENMDYDPVERELYWSTEQHTLMKRKIDGKGGEFVVIHDEEVVIRSVAIDWLTRHAYTLNKLDFRQMELSNMSIHLKLPFIDVVFEVFGSILTYDREMLEERLEINVQIFHELDLDVFNGHVYSLPIVPDYDGLYGKLIRFETATFNSKLTKYRPVVVKIFKQKTIRTPFTYDTLNNQLYFIIAEPDADYLHVINVDGTGNKTVTFNHYYEGIVVIFGDSLYYFSQEESSMFIKQMDRKTFQVVSSAPFTLRPNTVITKGLNLHTTNTNEDTHDCKDYQLCWSSINSWTCLETSEICDGVNDCYDGHDEYYCSLCTYNCSIVSFKMACYNPDFQTSDMLNTTLLSDFIHWNENPISKLVTIENVLNHDCFINIEMESSISRHIKRFEITSLQRLHKIRQAILSPLFSNLSYVLHADLTGGPMLSAGSNGISVFESVRDLKIQKSLFVDLLEDTFKKPSKLVHITLSDNPMLRSIHDMCFSGLVELEMLSITGSNLGSLSGSAFVDLANLTSLNLSFNNIQLLGEGIFDHLVNLLVVDIRGNDIQLTSELFLQTNMLEQIYCDSFTICCIKPKSVNEGNCSAARDDISSCSNLIENRALAAFLWIFGVMALCGNLFVVIYRGFIDKSIFNKSYFIFIYNLSLSDWLMSVYMIIIAIHDARFDGIYVWNDYPWKHSIICRISGMLSMISSEASVMFVSLITLERYICVKFAFGTVKLSRKLAVLISLAVWLFASFLSVIPTIFYPEFYSRSGVCVGIPLTQNNEQGLEYSTFVFLGLNYVFSIIILFGQYHILDEVRKAGKHVRSTQKGRNAAVAKRLAVVVITDCICWLPIGILVSLSLAGIKTTRDIYAWVVIFVLPINAAVNPYLYTLPDVQWNKVKACFNCKTKGGLRKIRKT